MSGDTVLFPITLLASVMRLSCGLLLYSHHDTVAAITWLRSSRYPFWKNRCRYQSANCNSRICRFLQGCWTNFSKYLTPRELWIKSKNKRSCFDRRSDLSLCGLRTPHTHRFSKKSNFKFQFFWYDAIPLGIKSYLGQSPQLYTLLSQNSHPFPAVKIKSAHVQIS